MVNSCYYIIKDVVTSKKNDLSIGVRIFSINTPCPIISFEEGEGPFLKLNHLIENSIILKDLKTHNPKRAHKIVQENYILKIETGVSIPKGITFEKDFINAFQHALVGEFKKEKLTGIHFYDERYIKIIELLNSDKKGVWSAIIEKKDEKNKWIRKQNSSTFFPKSWNKANLLEELNYASKNARLIIGTTNKYEAYTYSGIKVEIVIVNNVMKTIYPILES
jgi:hypothetical protein